MIPRSTPTLEGSSGTLQASVVWGTIEPEGGTHPADSNSSQTSTTSRGPLQGQREVFFHILPVTHSFPPTHLASTLSLDNKVLIPFAS
jgi:hypothetical protein